MKPPHGPEPFGHYLLHTLIGQGGMGEVYRAYDTRKRRWVALKRLNTPIAGDAAFEARFRREAEVAGRLREAHVIPIHDYGEIEGQLYIDMRLVDGIDLASMLEDHGPLDVRFAVDVVAQIAAALDAAHREGLIHRDVKPSNILIDGGEFAYLVDFGIVHSADGDRLTPSDAAIGTLAYMAPERFGAGPVDQRVDVYALGCVLYEAIAGVRPFPAASREAEMFAHLDAPPPRLSDRRREVSTRLDDVVMQALAKDPASRFGSAGALGAAARVAVGAASPSASSPPTWRFTQPSTFASTGPSTGPSTQPRHAAGNDASPAGPRPASNTPQADGGRRRQRVRAVVVAATVLAAAVVVGVVVESRSGGGAATTPGPGLPSASAPPVSAPPATDAASPTGTAPTADPTAPKVLIRVYNNSTITGLGARAAADFRAAGWPVAQVSNYGSGIVAASTVYYRPATDEQASAAALGAQFGLRVEPRFSGIDDAAPGLIVIVRNDYHKR